jgi:Flp pilus assembly secretin CpaC
MNKFSQSLIALSAILVFVVNSSAQEIHIKARFLEVPKDMLEAFKKDIGVASDGTKLLTPEQMNTTIQDLEADSSVETLAEPEVITKSGRQAQMRITTIQTIITNFVFQDSTFVNGAAIQDGISPQTESVESGPVLDVAPTISNDGLKIELTTIASDTKFFGYADPGNSPERFATNSAGQKINLPLIFPVLQMNQAVAKVTVADGQTLVLFPKANPQTDQRLAKHIAQAEKKSGEKFLVALITPTIVDAAGNRIHSDN